MGVKQVTLLAVAAVAGLVLAACQAPLDRLVTGYTALWRPRRAGTSLEELTSRKSKGTPKPPQ